MRVDRLSFRLLTACLWITPFMVYGRWPDFSRAPKLSVLLFLGLGLGALHLWDLWRRYSLDSVGLPPSAAGGALLIAYVGLRALFAHNGYEADARWLFVCATFGLVLASARIRWSERRLITLAGGLAIVALITFVLAVAQFFEQPWALAIPSTGHPSGTLGYRNMLAMGLNAFIAFGFVALIPARDARARFLRGLTLIASLAAACALILTRTRGAWVGFAGATLIFGVCFRRWHRAQPDEARQPWSARQKVAAFAVAGSFLAILGLAFSLKKPLPAGDRNQAVATYGATAREITSKKATVADTLALFLEGEDAGRLFLNRTTLAMYLDDPILGVGPGQWPVRYPFYSRDARGVPNASMRLIYQRAHNDWLQWLAEMGLVGFLLAVATALPLAAWAWRTLRRTGGIDWPIAATFFAIFASAALGIHAAVSFPFEMPLPSMYLAVSLGLVAAAHRANLTDLPEQPRRNPWCRWSSVGAWRPPRSVLLCLALAGTFVSIRGADFVGRLVLAQDAIGSAQRARSMSEKERLLTAAVGYEPGNHMVVWSMLSHAVVGWTEACEASDRNPSPATFAEEDRWVAKVASADERYFELTANPPALLAAMKVWAKIGDRAGRREHSNASGMSRPPYRAKEAYQRAKEQAELVLTLNSKAFPARFVGAKATFQMGDRAAGLESFQANIHPERDPLEEWANLAQMAAATEGYAALGYHALHHIQVVSAGTADSESFTKPEWFAGALRATRHDSGIAFFDSFASYRSEPQAQGWRVDPHASASIVTEATDPLQFPRRILHVSAPAQTEVALRRMFPIAPEATYTIRVRGRVGAGAPALGLVREKESEWLAAVPIENGDRTVEWSNLTDERLIVVLGRAPGTRPAAIEAWVEEIEVIRARE